jgi:hypothetical protein
MLENRKTREFSGQDARQGFIVLRTPLRKAVFIAGLAGFVLLSVVVALSACVPTP